MCRYTNRIPITQEFVPSDAEQKLYDLVSLSANSECCRDKKARIFLINEGVDEKNDN